MYGFASWSIGLRIYCRDAGLAGLRLRFRWGMVATGYGGFAPFSFVPVIIYCRDIAHRGETRLQKRRAPSCRDAQGVGFRVKGSSRFGVQALCAGEMGHAPGDGGANPLMQQRCCGLGAARCCRPPRPPPNPPAADSGQGEGVRLRWVLLDRSRGRVTAQGEPGVNTGQTQGNPHCERQWRRRVKTQSKHEKRRASTHENQIP